AARGPGEPPPALHHAGATLPGRARGRRRPGDGRHAREPGGARLTPTPGSPGWGDAPPADDVSRSHVDEREVSSVATTRPAAPGTPPRSPRGGFRWHLHAGDLGAAALAVIGATIGLWITSWLVPGANLGGPWWLLLSGLLVAVCGVILRI